MTRSHTWGFYGHLMLTERAGHTARAAIYAVALIPTGVAALWTRYPATSPDRPSRWLLVRHTAVTVLLGAVAWILAGVIALMVIRGAFYGLVDNGPYDDAWGGPTRGGAWLVHFAVSVPIAALAVLLLAGVAYLHRQMSRRLDGGHIARWVTPVVVVLGTAVTLFVVAWTRQL